MGDMSGIEPPRMNWLATDLHTEFRSFRQYCELIFSGPFAEKGQSERVTYILLCHMGRTGGSANVQFVGPQ